MPPDSTPQKGVYESVRFGTAISNFVYTVYLYMYMYILYIYIYMYIYISISESKKFEFKTRDKGFRLLSDNQGYN